MSEPDLVLLVARCFQDFMDVENYDPNTCYVPPSLETLDDRAKQNYLNDALFHRKVDTVVYVVNEHIAALRSQVAELQREKIEWATSRSKLDYQITELQRQLSAEQEAHAATIQREAKLALQLNNLPAIIEQAKAEEADRIGKLIHWPECWDTAAYPTLEDALTEINHCTVCENPEAHGYPKDWKQQRAAIRARKP